MAILQGFPPNNRLWGGGLDTAQIRSNVRHTIPFPSCLPQELETRWPMTHRSPQVSEHLRRQTERVRAALVVYALNVMEDMAVEPTLETMQDCIDIGEELYAHYRFERDGAYGDYIQSHFRRLLQEKDYYTKIVSKSLFG